MNMLLDQKVRCALCGYEFDPSQARLACSGCVLARGCRYLCCPRCDYTAPASEGSILVRLFDRLIGWRERP